METVFRSDGLIGSFNWFAYSKPLIVFSFLAVLATRRLGGYAIAIGDRHLEIGNLARLVLVS